MSDYSIKDLELLSGIKAHTLRIWEQRYNIINPKRTDTNIRTYDDHDLKLILNIALLKDHNYKISEIAKMTISEINTEVLTISDKKLNNLDQIHALTISMLDLDEDRFEKIMNTNILQSGFENTMLNIIYPFLSRIGTLWITGSVGPAQEHFMSNLIRQKIIVAIDGQVFKKDEASKSFLLYCPEGEMHEIGLLFAAYILKSRNHKVIYLGQSLPFNELEFAHKLHQPDYIYGAITSTPGQDEIQKYVNKLGTVFKDTAILLTGYQVVGQDLSCPPNINIISNARDLMAIATGQ